MLLKLLGLHLDCVCVCERMCVLCCVLVLCFVLRILWSWLVCCECMLTVYFVSWVHFVLLSVHPLMTLY